jgi:hypothetical protein
MAKAKKKKNAPARDLAAKKNVKGGGAQANLPHTPITNFGDTPGLNGGDMVAKIKPH